MKDVTSKKLHEQTADCLNLVRQGQRLRIVRNGKPEAMLVPVKDRIDPSWDEIMAEVWKAQKESGPKTPNPVLAERKRRNYAARVR